MEFDFNIQELIDLSFLTDEEQDVIAQVLHRDTKLRLLEEQRVKWAEINFISNLNYWKSDK